MWSKISRIVDFISNMGWRYIAFRLWHLFQIKTGIFKNKFPAQPQLKSFISLNEWKALDIPFFIDGKESLNIKKELSSSLELRFRESVKNNITFFNSTSLQLETESQWSVNPSNGFKYDMYKHWSQIPDLSKEAGDIKFVWEKARFSYLYDIMRYDYHSGEDQAAFVFSEIEDFIDKNPLNLGPQYKCSQEISLRIFNWTYALHFYKKSTVLNEELFVKIMNAIYWQLHHVRNNIHFSRIAVRNNHAITETLMLYLSGLLFPFIPETKQWSKDGKKWFEQEVDYQIYEDGTFLQYSMNYHRVAIQLLTLGIRLSELNDDEFHPIVKERANKSLLPNIIDKTQNELSSFEKGGYYIINEKRSKTFIRCGSYTDRPAQADNLHLDLWVDGVNYIWDCGSYKYNTEEHYMKHFTGTAGYNTVTVNGQDQMLKGGRFIWFYWIKKAKAKLVKNNNFEFEGSIDAYRQLRTIHHTRKVVKEPKALSWQVIDTVGSKSQLMTQHWHINPATFEKITFVALDESGKEIKPMLEEKWMSSYYGVKEPSIALKFETTSTTITTKILIKA